MCHEGSYHCHWLNSGSGREGVWFKPRPPPLEWKCEIFPNTVGFIVRERSRVRGMASSIASNCSNPFKAAEQQQYNDWYTDRWWVSCYIWYSEEGPGWAVNSPGGSTLQCGTWLWDDMTLKSSGYIPLQTPLEKIWKWALTHTPDSNWPTRRIIFCKLTLICTSRPIRLGGNLRGIYVRGLCSCTSFPRRGAYCCNYNKKRNIATS